jgi:hypothetical protein
MTFKINAAARLKATQVRVAGSGDAWWNSLSKKQQQEYIKLHPKSKYAKQGGPGGNKKSAPKPSKGPAIPEDEMPSASYELYHNGSLVDTFSSEEEAKAYIKKSTAKGIDPSEFDIETVYED